MNPPPLQSATQKTTTPTESWEELKNDIYPLLLGYYEEGETYQRADKYADEAWGKICTQLDLAFKAGERNVLGNVGMLRQWLNEDRTPRSDKPLITNEDIVHFLTFTTRKDGGI